ncbi:MAG: YebC/PmpR family DNA-binding transcriptional regulator [bacterium]|jgi:YebC/PmpR family DNA-binding regulatory protein
MSGHSKWSTIKRKKGKADAQRGRIFTKIIREITVAAKDGGGDPSANPRLRTAIDSAKAANMPTANVEKAIKRGTGELPGVNYEEHSYEGYGPAGVAIMVETLTDNKNRTTSEIRHILTKHGGHLGEVGCVSWMFNQQGSLIVDRDKAGEDEVMAAALEAGAEDVIAETEYFEVVTAPKDFDKVKKAFDEKGIAYSSAELTRNPQTTVKVEGKQAGQILRIMDLLEDHDDIQKVFANFDVPDEVMEELSEE